MLIISASWASYPHSIIFLPGCPWETCPKMCIIRCTQKCFNSFFFCPYLLALSVTSEFSLGIVLLKAVPYSSCLKFYIGRSIEEETSDWSISVMLWQTCCLIHHGLFCTRDPIELTLLRLPSSSWHCNAMCSYPISWRVCCGC